jgi:hypothetical protein
MAAESFYRDANTLLYADNKPTEDAIDRVVGKINREYVVILLVFPTALTLCYSIDKKGKFSRKRLNEDEGDITYINERNRVFNKKVCYSTPTPLKYKLKMSNRLHDTTTNIPQRFGLVSSGERRYEHRRFNLSQHTHVEYVHLHMTCNIIKIY